MTNMKAIPELSVDTQTIERMLAATNIGDTIGYDTLAAAIGRDVRRAARHVLTAARKRLLRASHMVFESVSGIGVKRLDDAGKIATGRHHLGKARRQATFARTKTAAVDSFDTLPNALKVEHNIVLAQAGMLRAATSPSTAKKLSARMSEPVKQIDLRKCLSDMKSVL